MYETHLDELIYQTTLKLDNINNKLPLQNYVNLNRLNSQIDLYPH